MACWRCCGHRMGQAPAARPGCGRRGVLGRREGNPRYTITVWTEQEEVPLDLYDALVGRRHARLTGRVLPAHAHDEEALLAGPRGEAGVVTVTRKHYLYRRHLPQPARVYLHGQVDQRRYSDQPD